MKPVFLCLVTTFALTGCSVRDESADISHCRENASQRVAKAARSVDATYDLCTSAKAEKRHAEENKESAATIAAFIADILD